MKSKDLKPGTTYMVQQYLGDSTAQPATLIEIEPATRTGRYSWEKGTAARAVFQTPGRTYTFSVPLARVIETREAAQQRQARHAEEQASRRAAAYKRSTAHNLRGQAATLQRQIDQLLQEAAAYEREADVADATTDSEWKIARTLLTSELSAWEILDVVGAAAA